MKGTRHDWRYVALSRCKTLQGLYLCDPMPHDPSKYQLPRALSEEMARLFHLECTLLSRVPAGVASVPVHDLIRELRQSHGVADALPVRVPVAAPVVSRLRFRGPREPHAASAAITVSQQVRTALQTWAQAPAARWRNKIGCMGAGAWAYIPIIRAALDLSPHAHVAPDWWSRLSRAYDWPALVASYAADFAKRGITKEALPWRSPATSHAYLEEHHAQQLLSPVDVRPPATEAEQQQNPQRQRAGRPRRSRNFKTHLVYGPSGVYKTDWDKLTQCFSDLARDHAYDIQGKLHQLLSA